MVLDALGLAALADELRAHVVGARIQDTVQPHRLALTLELYAIRRTYLTLSADGSEPGVLYCADRPRRGDGASTPLTLAVRSRAMGGRLVAVEQPAYERILDLTIDAGEPLRLVAEVMGRMANLVLLDGRGVVLAAARQVTPRMTRARVVLPGLPYEAPPRPGKVPPDAVEEPLVANWLAEEPDASADAVLVRHVLGLSPMAAREVAVRATAAIGPDAPDRLPAALAGALAELFAPMHDGRWQPSIALAQGRVVAYAPYMMTRHPLDDSTDARIEAAESMASAVCAYEADRGAADPYRRAREAVARDVAGALEKALRRREAIERQNWNEPEIEELRLCGDWILASRTRIRRGDRTLEVIDVDGARRRIALDPALSAVENAQSYYARYRRRRRAAEAYHERAAAAAAELAALEQWAVDLDLAEDRPAIDAVRDALVAGGHLPRGRTRPAPAGRPLALFSSDGFKMLVGRNSRQNEQVTFERSARGDLWLHARGVPGGHVVVQSGGRVVPEATLLEAAAIAAHYSGARSEGRVTVAVTDIRNVRHMRGGSPGMVTYDHEWTVLVEPRSPGDLGLA